MPVEVYRGPAHRPSVMNLVEFELDRVYRHITANIAAYYYIKVLVEGKGICRILASLDRLHLAWLHLNLDEIQADEP